MDDSSLPKSERDSEIDQLRRILFGRDGVYVRQALSPEVKDLVVSVLSEALHERQRRDNSIVSVIQPLVERSVETSVSQHGEKLTTILYPLVGSMVRKSISAFLNQFVEKTNTLIENAVSIRGLKLRLEAWRAGIPFSRYILLKSYQYRVDTLLLIHRETGTLLNIVAEDAESKDNADLVSAMLTAINDFVSDSFLHHENEQQLDEIKTADLTLYVSHGPSALLVASSQGTIPYDKRVRFSEALEQIHGIFSKELIDFGGDSSVFEAADSILQNCMFNEKKADAIEKKKPWMGYIALASSVAFVIWVGVLLFQAQAVKSKLQSLETEPGIVITKLDIENFNDVHISLMRDPLAVKIEDWLEKESLEDENIVVHETPFQSLEKHILDGYLDAFIKQYPDINFEIRESNTNQSVSQELFLFGSLSSTSIEEFLQRLLLVPGINRYTLNYSQLELTEIELDSATKLNMKQAMFERLIGNLSGFQIDFDVNNTSLDTLQKEKLKSLSKTLIHLKQLASELNIDTNIMIIGTSDSIGQTSKNIELSRSRADTVKSHLIQLGVDRAFLFATGIGEVVLSSSGVTTRKVVFTVMYSPVPQSGTSVVSQ